VVVVGPGFSWWGHASIGSVRGAFQSKFGPKLPLLPAFRGPEARKVHFRCIYDGLFFRRFRSRVPGDPQKFLGGSASPKGPVKPLFGLRGDARPSAGRMECPQAATGTRYKNNA